MARAFVLIKSHFFGTKFTEQVISANDCYLGCFGALFCIVVLAVAARVFIRICSR